MSRLNTITACLRNIRQTLLQHPVFTRGTGVTVDDPAYAREAEELDHMSERLLILIQHVRNHQHLLSAAEQGLWNVPREKRYSAAQSIAQQQADAERVMQLAADVKDLLDDLMRRNCRVSDGDIADKMGEFIKECHEWTHTSEQTQVSGPHSDGAVYLAPGQFSATPEAATIAVWAALRTLAYFLRKRKGRSS